LLATQSLAAARMERFGGEMGLAQSRVTHFTDRDPPDFNDGDHLISWSVTVAGGKPRQWEGY
jgi:hypothetical protein